MSSELTPTPELLAGLWNRMRVGEHGMKHTCYYEFFDWHAAEIRRAKADGWNEGYQACHDDYQRDTGPLLAPNPYLADQAEEDQQERKGSIMDYAGIWGPRPEGLDVVEWQREIRDEQ